MSSPSGAVIGVLIDARRVLEAAALLLQLNATGTLLPRIFFCHAALPPRDERFLQSLGGQVMAAPRRKDSRRSSFERQGQAKSDGSLLGRLSTVGGGRRQSLPGQRGSHVGHNHKLHAAVGLRLDL